VQFWDVDSDGGGGAYGVTPGPISDEHISADGKTLAVGFGIQGWALLCLDDTRQSSHRGRGLRARGARRRYHEPSHP
jgi:hypothetical protein